MDKRLYRSRKDRMILGVCGGLADYFNIDPAIVRVVLVLLALIPPHGIVILAYIVLAIVVPEERARSTQPSDVVKQNLEDIGNSASQLGYEIRATFKDGSYARSRERNRNLAGSILILVGVIFLLANLSPFWWLSFSFLWPLVLVVVGLALIFSWRRT